MRKIFKKTMLIVFSLLFALVLPVTANAVSTSEAGEPIDTDRLCSLTVHYGKKEKKFQGLEIRLFQVAELTEDNKYSLMGDFADYPVDIDNITGQAEWENVVSTLNAYIIADGITPTAIKTTDENGEVVFTDLSAGIYLVQGTEDITDGTVTSFKPFLIALPNLNTDKMWEYEVIVIPKSGENVPTGKEIAYSVIKQWRDAGHTDKRPDSVEIEIYKNGKLYEKQVLSENNNWTYKWIAIDDGSEWQVVERKVPSQYTVTVSSSNTSFIVTNTYIGKTVNPPQTGDTTNIRLYFIVLCISGIGLIITGVCARKRMKADE